MLQPGPVTIPESLARRLAVEHHVDPRSIRREAAQPGSVRGMAGERARAAARAALAEMRATTTTT